MEPLKPTLNVAEAVEAKSPQVHPSPPRVRRRWSVLVALLVISWAPPTTWVALTLPRAPGGQPAALTKTRLAQLSKTLRRFLEKHKKAPSTLNVLRAFAHGEALAFQAHDGYGERFDYLRLDERHYLLRSFGGDQAQNTLGGVPDFGLVSWGQIPRGPIRYRLSARPGLGLYPSPLLEGADSPDGISHARLFVNPVAQTRSLVARLKERGELFMVAPHDRIEEFLWLPSSTKIVYTATGSSRHRDGLYLWDLDTDKVENLTDLARGSLPISPSSRGEGKLWLSLAGISSSGPTVYAYAALRHDGTLDPGLFYHPSSLVAFQLTDGTKAKLLPNGTNAAAKLLENMDPPHRRPLELGTGLEARNGSVAQNDWLRLSFAGELEKVLLVWHDFAEKHTASPIFPYALWLLSSLYGEGFELLAKVGTKDADVLRTFGIEIARALINNELAPTYLKSMGLFNHEQLMDGLALPYTMARLEVAPPEKSAEVSPPGPPAPEAPEPTPKKDPKP